MWATIAKHFSLTKQVKYKFHPISYPWKEDKPIWVQPHGFNQQIIYIQCPIEVVNIEMFETIPQGSAKFTKK